MKCSYHFLVNKKRKIIIFYFLPFYTEMDDKNDLKGKFFFNPFYSINHLFLYHFKIDKVNFLLSTERYDKFIFFFSNLLFSI